MGQKSLFFIWFFCFSGNLFAQENHIFSIKDISQEGILVDKEWKFKVGDNSEYASLDFDDKGYDIVKAHEGKIELETQSSDGCIFTLILLTS